IWISTYPFSLARPTMLWLSGLSRRAGTADMISIRSMFTLPPSADQDSGIEACVCHYPLRIHIHQQMELKELLCQFLLPGLNEPGYPLHRGHFQVSHWSLQR